jgi:PPOX class probable F420-dependent enzyme
MGVSVPERLAYLLQRETRAFAHLALVRANGTPHVSPIWFDYDGTFFIFNTARGRVKDRVMAKRPVVAFDIVAPSNPYQYLLVRGRVVDETEEAAYDQICALNEKYHGSYEYPRRPGEVRVTYKVAPDKFYPTK